MREQAQTEAPSSSDGHIPAPGPGPAVLPVQPRPRGEFGQPVFPAMPDSPSGWRYRPPAAASWWHRHSRTLRALAVTGLLGACGAGILLLVREQTGTAGLAVGLVLAPFPVPVLVGVFRWLDGVEPAPWRVHLFAFGWGAGAATLVALLTNSLATDWISTSMGAGTHRADALGSTVVAPVVEESAKAASVLLLFLFRRRFFVGVVSGMAVAGVTATGFAFTENVLYLGTAFGEDLLEGPQGPADSLTVTTFLVRVVLAPFAHPLFTAFTGIGFGIVAAVPGMRRGLRLLVPCLGLLTAVLLHSVWNGAAGLPGAAFLAVYTLFMMPVLATLTWLAVWSRRNELRMVRDTLADYSAAGWLDRVEPPALASMKARSAARAHARRFLGPDAARTTAEYQHFATALALLRARAQQGVPPTDFTSREQELLHHLWHRRPLAAPATVAAAHSVAAAEWPARAGQGGGGFRAGG